MNYVAIYNSQAGVTKLLNGRDADKVQCFPATFDGRKLSVDRRVAYHLKDQPTDTIVFFVTRYENGAPKVHKNQGLLRRHKAKFSNRVMMTVA